MRKLAYVIGLFALLLAGLPAATAQEDGMGGSNVIVTLAPTDAADGAGLSGVTGWAHVVSDEGRVQISLEPNGATLPEGAVLEGWLVDAGLNGGPGTTNVTDDDEQYGVSFGNADFDAAVESAPYALSTGALTPTDSGTWELTFTIPAYNFSPYDAVVITLESDGNSPDGFDPRPGTPVFTGLIAEGEPAGDDMRGDDMSGDEMSDDDMGEADEMGDDMSADDMSGDEMSDEDMGADDMGEDTAG